MEQIVESLIQALPNNVEPLKKIKYKPRERKKKVELELVLLISDLQAGHKTATFNHKVLYKRMEHLVKKTIEITELWRATHKVDKLNIFLLGDNIQHERIGALVDLDALEAVLMEQVYDMAIPTLENAIWTLGENFNKLDIYCVRGNHGGNGKYSAPSTNWDDVIYHFLKERFRKSKHINWYLTNRFFQLAQIKQLKFMLTHGDKIPIYQNTPIYGINHRALRWYNTVEQFDVLTLGHFHVYHSWDIGGIHIIINGTFVSDDDYAVSKYGLQSAPSQVLLGVVRNMIVFESKIYLP